MTIIKQFGVACPSASSGLRTDSDAESASGGAGSGDAAGGSLEYQAGARFLGGLGALDECVPLEDDDQAPEE